MLPSLIGVIASSGGVATSYESISTVTVGSGGTGAIYFNNIPQTYTHLQIRILGRSRQAATTASLYYSLYNGGTTPSANADHQLYGNGSSAAARSDTGLGYMFANTVFPAANSTSGIFGALVVDVLDYTNTNKNKTVRILGGNDQNGSGQIALTSGLPIMTNAVNDFWVDTEGGWAQYTQVALYGIKG